MDPNETLRRFRDAMTEVRKFDAMIDEGERFDQPLSTSVFENRDMYAVEAARMMEDMDDWFSKGGFLPDEWAKGRA